MNKHSEIKFKQNLLDKEDSRLELTLEGSDINHVVVNTLRRVGMTDVPIYSFDQVDISENKSVFNNDYMRLRIRTLPITNIKNDNVFVEAVTNSATLLKSLGFTHLQVACTDGTPMHNWTKASCNRTDLFQYESEEVQETCIPVKLRLL